MRNLLLMTGILFLVASCGAKQINDEVVTTVDVKKAKEILAKEKVQLVDVRTPEEYSNGHIDGAINIDVTDDSFTEKIRTLSKEEPVMVYCRSGHRSARAAEILKEKGFKKVYNLDGGFIAWSREK